MTIEELIKDLGRRLSKIAIDMESSNSASELLYVGYTGNETISGKISRLAEFIEDAAEDFALNEDLSHVDFESEYPFYSLMAKDIAEGYADLLIILKRGIDNGNLAEQMEYEGHDTFDEILYHLTGVDSYTEGLQENDYYNKESLRKALKKNIEKEAISDRGVSLDDFNKDMDYLTNYIRDEDSTVSWTSRDLERLQDDYSEIAERQAREHERIGFLDNALDSLIGEDGSFSIINLLEIEASDFPFTKKEFTDSGIIELCFMPSSSDASIYIKKDLKNMSRASANIRVNIAVTPIVSSTAIDYLKSAVAQIANMSFGKVILLHRIPIAAKSGYSYHMYQDGSAFHLGEEETLDVNLYDSIHINISTDPREDGDAKESVVTLDVEDDGNLKEKLKVSVFNNPISERYIYIQLVARELSEQDFPEYSGNILYLESSPTMSLNMFSFTNKDSVSSHYLSLMGSFGQLKIQNPMAVDAKTYLAGGRGLEKPLPIVITYPISREDAHLVEKRTSAMYVIKQQNFGVAERAFAPISAKQAYSVNITNYVFENKDIDTNTLTLRQVSPRYHKEYTTNSYEGYEKIASRVGGSFFQNSKDSNTKECILVSLYGYQTKSIPNTSNSGYTVKPQKGSNFIATYYTSYYVGLIAGRFEEHAHKATSILLTNPLTMVLDSLFYHYTGETVADPLSVYANKMLPFLVEKGAIGLIKPDSNANMLLDTISGKTSEYLPILEVLKSYTDELTRPFALLFAAINIQDYATRSNPYVEEGDFVGSILTKQNNTVGHYLDSVSMATLDFSSSSRSLLGTLATDSTVITRETKLSEVSRELLECELQSLSSEPCIAAYHSIQNIDDNIFVEEGNKYFAPKGEESFFSQIDSNAFDDVRQGYREHVPTRVLGEYQLYSDNIYDVSLYDALAQRNMYYTFEFFAKKTSVVLNNWHSGYFNSAFKERVAGRVGGKLDGTLVNLTSIFETYHCAEALRKVWSNRNKKVNLDDNRVSKNVVATQKKAMPYLLIEAVLANTNGIEQGATAPTPMQYAVILELMSATYETIFNTQAEFGSLVAQSDYAKLYVVTSESGEENVKKAMKSMSAKGGSICIGQYESYRNATISGTTNTFTVNDNREGITGVITVSLRNEEGDITEAKGYNNQMYGSSRESSYGSYTYSLGTLFDNITVQVIADAVNAALISHCLSVEYGENIGNMHMATLSDIQDFYSRAFDKYDFIYFYNDILGETKPMFRAAVVLATQGDPTYRRNVTVLKDEDLMAIGQYLLNEEDGFADDLGFMQDADSYIYKKIKPQIEEDIISIMEPTGGALDE